MENASKALIIAGAVIIAILIISLGVLMFNRMGGTAKEAADMDEQIISAFNSRITPYLGSSVAGTQVNALLQYCLSSNMAAKNSGETYKYITVTGATSLDGTSTTFTRVESGGKYYTVQGTPDGNGLITTIVINQNP